MSALSYHNHAVKRNTPDADARHERALALLDSGSVQPYGGPGLYAVRSQHDGGRTYLVDLNLSSCTCPDRVYNKTVCKHITAARLLAWEQRVVQLAEQHGLSLQRLQDRILANVVMNDHMTGAQREALDAIERVWQRAQGVAR